MKMIDSQVLLNKRLKNKIFKKEYNNLEEEFEIAKEVIYLRQKAKMTQRELATKAGTSQPAIARLESGQYKNVSMAFLRKIGNALNAFPEIHFREHKIKSA